MQVAAIAGWYHDGHGLRWWSGTEWGPYAPTFGWVDPQSDEAGKNMAMAAHAGPLAGGFVLPLIVYLTQKDKNSFARFHAAEALNFQLTFIAAWFASFPLMFGLMFLFSSNGQFPWPVFVLMPLMFVLMIANYGFSAIAAMKASRLIRWKYPLRIPFVRATERA